MLRIGVGQTNNTTCVETNSSSIESLLRRFELERVDLVLFPECSVSGFSSKISASMDQLSKSLSLVRNWSKNTGIAVALPTAIAEDGKVYNSGYWIAGEHAQRFYKLGLTKSERSFFSIPAQRSEKVFEIKGYRCAILICMEAQLSPWTYFNSGDVDFILWPAYWGWKREHDWTNVLEGKENLVFKNMQAWQVPLIQANFAANSLDDNRRSGPEGLSVVIDGQNKLCHRGSHLRECGFVVNLSEKNGKLVVTDCSEAQ